MDKRNLLGRIATCVVFPPLIFCVLYYLNQCNCLIPSAIVFAVALRASKEMDGILFSIGERRLLPFWLPPLLVVIDWVGIYLGGGYEGLGFFALYSMIVVIFLVEIFAGSSDDPPYRDSVRRVARTILLVVYPNSFLMIWPEIMNLNENGNLIFFFMLVLVFSNDVFCYVFGMLFGKGNRGYVKASPNKSLAGYIAGFALTPLLGCVYVRVFPSVGAYFGSPYVVIGLSLMTALASDIGDIIESVFKRCGHIKDSGNVIPGRGGMLDNIDSIMASSALFYFFTKAMFSHISHAL